VTFTSLVEAEEKLAEAWGKDVPAAARLTIRICMGSGNAQLKIVDNDLFPEVKPTTNLESIAKKALTKQGLIS
jgi:hypothetical protein